MNTEDPHNLERFITAQAQDYESALVELRAGEKITLDLVYIPSNRRFRL